MRWDLLQELDAEQRRTVMRLTRRRRFGRGEVVFHDGDPGDTLHLVSNGHFAVRITTPLGDVATVRVLGAGEHFGELAVLAPGPRRGSVVALEGGETQSLHRDDVDRLRSTMPAVDRVLRDALIAEVRRLSAALLDALYLPAERRVWRRLDDLVTLYGTDPPVVLALTQDDVAQLAGTTRPTVNRVLRKGADDGLVRLTRGRIEVVDLAALRRVAR